MSEQANINEQEVDSLYLKLKQDGEKSGYYLNPDINFTKDLVKSLIINQQRFGYEACPCRLASGKREEDLDIICPCDYRDADVNQYEVCYCALYVSKKAGNGESAVKSIPERRPTKQMRLKMKEEKQQENAKGLSNLPLPVYRCKVCGYLCARQEPPDICPICKVTKDRFERFA
ncbi:MAG: ferredoxin:glutaredoxin reductase [Candidatus Firestonebacteria bacterium RIFOXYC2_FULL_39_67]|nr:MAG: ferredoxin:glutaredoxin reductase [Candidatus Firestonebacteria bacterium RIFOXYD2_FULL_39_29]OGF55050.1 MAG: ferredoxin:glutaredoxin reductase [Candidatus Firestonebacteria bacterium RifOxyC12_full_39_7]OGF56409.1 MAG: ferredoxin:glutaredoxin reductase [Candidatus Firestonebacteria bacterium RIFOXYC2_FULL_39_67]